MVQKNQQKYVQIYQQKNEMPPRQGQKRDMLHQSHKGALVLE